MCQVSLKDMVDDSSIQFVDAEVSCVGTGRRQGVKGLAVTCEGRLRPRQTFPGQARTGRLEGACSPDATPRDLEVFHALCRFCLRRLWHAL